MDANSDMETQDMNQPNVSGNTNAHDMNEKASVSRRVADELHDRIDKAAKTGEKLEQNLHERGTQAQDKARELGNSLSSMARSNPWAVIGGSVALGIVLGSILGRR